MNEKKKDKKERAWLALKELLGPLYTKLEAIDTLLKKDGIKTKKYYRNEDLKLLFGLSNNTIIKYRQSGVLPFTKLGDIFLYEALKIDRILRQNQP
ncbi:DNA-binding protein [Flavobacterium sp. RHBU_24]|uniref:DNA-binding protein n=1 Tax=Flavobacterium sp. RHBU_24 TaxID=3391185 RepID=UPI00398462BD